MRTIVFALATVTLVAPLGAQGRGRNTNGVPPGFRPPPGMCRVWIDGVPPGHQPGVTSCAAAFATVPGNGRVIFGDQFTANRYAHGHPSSYRAPRIGAILTRQLYDDDGNLVRQRLRRNANGTLTVLSSTLVTRAPRRGHEGDQGDNGDDHGGHGKGHGHGNGNGKGHG